MDVSSRTSIFGPQRRRAGDRRPGCAAAPPRVAPVGLSVNLPALQNQEARETPASCRGATGVRRPATPRVAAVRPAVRPQHKVRLERYAEQHPGRQQPPRHRAVLVAHRVGVQLIVCDHESRRAQPQGRTKDRLRVHRDGGLRAGCHDERLGVGTVANGYHDADLDRERRGQQPSRLANSAS